MAGPNVLRMACEGTMLYNRNHLYVGRSLELLGEYGPEETDLLWRSLQLSSTAIEVGANIGAQTVPMARKVGKAGKINAFESQQPML